MALLMVQLKEYKPHKATAAVLSTPRGHDTRRSKLLMQPHNTPSAPHVKICSKCGEAKPATTEYFYRDKNGLRADCKACVSERAHTNREHKREYNRRRYKANAEQFRAQSRAWYEAHKDEIKRRAAQRTREWYAANKERAAQTKRAYALSKKEEKAEYDRIRYQANKEQRRKYVKEWYRANPEVKRAQHLRRRALKANAAGSHTAEDIKTQYERQKGRCYWCGVKVGETYHVDHIVPLSRGGSNDPSNLVVACPTCNISKGSKLPHEWAKGGKLL